MQRQTYTGSKKVWWTSILTTFIICSILYLQLYLFKFSVFLLSNMLI